MPILNHAEASFEALHNVNHWGVIAALSRQKMRLVANLSGKSVTKMEDRVTPESPLTFPATMTRIVSYDDISNESELRQVQWRPVDESEDYW
jgi:hypothetical protein